MSDALCLTAIAHGQPQSTHLLAALRHRRWPSRRRLHAAGCSATTLGLRLLNLLLHFITFKHFYYWNI